ncbi:ESPR-type extended signal peptide-containing protein [Megasphaera stantonii]|uniref:SLH domain-containing protein n=1 Tax=Megasphaera stantonii TaxID=2144175 RepID=A0A346B2E8_9FIRM|nr:ESPR-type extended signal peptide-containing protein [Megasphaera stantonii]AXL22291.1 hypothetical protein DKB62_12365 [Megasphaera stantonii]
MNKIYKVIWSKVKHQYVVTSEFAHSCTKSTTSRAGRSAAAVLAALILTTGICAVPAQAADPTLEELYYEQLNSTVHNDETSSPVVKLVEAPTAVPTAAKDGEQAVDNDTQTGEDGGMTGAADQYTVVNEDGFYASNTKGTHNTLSKDGLWVGGKDDNTGFHVDNDGNVRTTGSVTVKSEQGDVIIQNGGVQAGNVKINTDGKNTITGLTNTTWDGTTETPDRAATEGQLGQVQGDLNELNKAAVKYDSDGQGGYTNNVTIGGQVTANSFQNTDGSFSVDANGNVDAETVKSEGMSVVDEDENTTFQVLANGDVTAHDVTATTVTGGTVIGETIRNTNNSFSVDANGNVDAETVKSEGMSVVDEDGNTTFQVLSNGDVTAHAVTATTVTGGTIQNADGSFSVDANGNVDAETVKSEGMSVVDEDGNTTFQVLANGDVTATTVTGGTVIGETIRNTNNSFSVDANGNVDAETVKSEGMSVVDEDGNTTFQVLSNGDVTAHAVTATTVTGGTIQNADGSFSVDANGNVDAETVKSEGMSVVDEDGNTTFQVLANGDVTAHDVTATTVTGGTVIGETIRNTNNSFSVDANGNVDAETVKSEGMSVVDEDGNTTFQVLSNGDVTAHAVTATTVTGGTIQNADGSFSVDANGNVDAETVKSEGMSVVDEDGNTTFQVLANGDVTAHDVIANSYSNVNGTFVADENGKVTAEKGDIGDVWLSEGNISNVKNIKAESGNIGDVKLADGKVTADKGDIGDVWLSEGNISNVKNIKAESGNIGDVKLADGKVTAEKGDIGDVWLSEGTISHVQNITAESGTIGNVELDDGKVTADKGDIGDVWLSEGNISNVKNIKAESGNIGDVKLADGKVTAQKADIGGVFIKNESIQAGNIKINENGSNEITGLSNTRWNDGTPVDEDRAATEGQLSTVQGYVDDLEKKTQHITHTATDNGHYTTIEDHTNFNSDGSIDAVDGQFRVTSDGGLMLKDEAGNETFRIYNGTGGMKAASGKFVVNGKTGEVTVDESLSVGKHDDGTYAFTVDKAGNAEVDGTMVIQGQTIINADADIKGSLGAAGNKFKVDGATGDVTANSYTTGDVRINTDGHNTITGLLNVEWSGNAEDIVADRAATEGQLLDVQGNLDTLAKGAVMYDVDEDGNVTDNVTIDGKMRASEFANSNNTFMVTEDGAIWASGGGNIDGVGFQDGVVTAPEGISAGYDAFKVDAQGNVSTDGTIIAQGNSMIGGVTLEDGNVLTNEVWAGNNNFHVNETGSVTAPSVTGLENTEWNADEVVADRAATEGQLLDVQGNLDTLSEGAVMYDVDEDGNVTDNVTIDGKMRASEFANSNNTFMVTEDGAIWASGGGNIDGVGFQDGVVTAPEGISAGYDAFKVDAQGNVSTDGTIIAQGNSMIGGVTLEDGNVLTNEVWAGNNNFHVNETGSVTAPSVTGLENTEWNADEVVADRAATEGQLLDVQGNLDTLSEGAVMYDVDEDGNVTDNVTIDGKMRASEFANSNNTFMVTEDGAIWASGGGNIDGVGFQDGVVTAPEGISAGYDAFKVDAQGNVSTDGTIIAQGNSMIGGVTLEDGNVLTNEVWAGNNNFHVNETGSVTAPSVTGLENTEWNADEVVADRAATEGQLLDVQGNLDTLSEGAVMYDVDEAGNITDNVTIGGKMEASEFANSNNTFMVTEDGAIWASGGGNIDGVGFQDGVVTAPEGISAGYDAFKVDAQGNVSTDGTIIAQGNSMIGGVTLEDGNVLTNEVWAGNNNFHVNETGSVTAPSVTGLENTEWNADEVVADRAATEGQLADIQKQVTNNTNNIGNLTTKFNEAGINTNSLEKAVAVANQLDGANLSALNALSQIAPMSLDVTMMTNSVLSAPQESPKGMRDPDPSEWGNNVTTEDMTTINNNLTVTGDTHLKGDLKVDGEATFNNNVSIKGDLNMNNNKITGVADGEISETSKDAVNGSQLYGVQQDVEANAKNISTLGGAVNKLGNRIDEVGAGAAALAALHPLDFDPDNKWDFSAGYGNYRGESAVAFGAFYRPNEDTMFSVGGTVGNDDNMVNAGVSIKIGSGSSGVTTSRVAMAKEIKAMRDVVAKQDAQIQKLTAMVNALVGIQSEPDTTTMFPDVPENHWAYEAVAAMARSGLVKGYPDGEFKGDRTMTRYEFAQIIQNAIQAGAEVDSRLVEEFKPELEYFHIATVAKDKDGNPTIERVRAN